METNYDKVEQSNGGKNMRFFEYLKKQEPSKENEEARNRIYKLHQLEGNALLILNEWKSSKKGKAPWKLSLSEES